MYGLTPTQRRCLTYIAVMQRQGCYCPSYDEIMEHLGLTSRSSICRLVNALVERGALRRIPNRARALQVTEAGMASVPRVGTATEHYEFIPACRLGIGRYGR